MRLYNLEVVLSQAISSLILLPIIYAIIYGVSRSVFRKHLNRFHMLVMSLFTIYILQVINLVFFPINYNLNFRGTWYTVLSDINLRVGYFGQFSTFNSSIETLLMNILLTIPFGLMLPFIIKMNSRMIVFVAPAVGLLLEGTQLALNLWLGYSYRVVDIHDVITNAIGILIGYSLFLLFSILYKSMRENQFNHADNSFTNYLDWVMYFDNISS